MHPSDHIPVLPAMPKPVIRRRRRSYRPWMVAIGVATAAALGLMVVGVKARYRTMADESFRRAEELFQSGAFTKAQQEFDFFGTEYSSDPRTHRAKLAAELSKVAQSIDDELADPNRVIESLDKFAADSRDSRSKASVQERWPVILTMAERTARSRLEKASQSLAAAELESGDTWLRWLHDQQKAQAEGSETPALADLDQLSAKVRDAIAVEERRRGFLDAADRTLADGTAAQFAEAFRAYDQWRAGAEGAPHPQPLSPTAGARGARQGQPLAPAAGERGRGEGADPAIAAMYERLRTALRSRVRFEPPPQSGETADSVPVLPVEAYTRLSTRTQHKTVAVASTRPVFARAKDLCFALEPATGAVRWVLRVGYDAPLPDVVAVTGRQLVVVPWFSDAAPMISLCDAATGESIWSWKVPDLLTGPPVVTRDSIFAATIGGSVWQLDLEHGTPRGVATLPEPIDSPVTLREDGKGFCVVGARQAVYLFDTSGEQPQCSDLVLFGRRPDTAHCQVMWVPPYVVIFENDLMNRCYVRVLFQEPTGLRQVRQLELDGRVWQPPVMDGADIFVMTDRWKIHCFGLDPGNSAVNLYQAASALKPPPDLRQPTRPQLARVTELPFVAVSDALYGYRVDRSQGLLREVWTRPLPQPDARGVQPIQTVQSLVVASFQEPSDDGILVQCYDSRQGDPVWETRLASAARGLATAGPPTDCREVLAHNNSGQVFVLSRDPAAGSWRSKSVDLPTPDSPVQFSDDFTEWAYASGGNRIVTGSRDAWTPRILTQNPSVHSRVALFYDVLQIADSEASRDQEDGSRNERTRLDLLRVPDRRRRKHLWATFVTTERTIEQRLLGSERHDVHGVRIPAKSSNSKAWRWAPLHLGANQLVVADPSGQVSLVERQRTEGIEHLTLIASRADLPELAVPPIPIREFVFCGTFMPPGVNLVQLVCFGRDGKCSVLDTRTLRTEATWQAPGVVVGEVLGEFGSLYLSLDDGTVHAIEWKKDNNGKLGLFPNWSVGLGNSGWKLAGLQPGHLIAFNAAGRVIALDMVSRSIVWSHDSPGPLVHAPERVGDELMLATTDGGVFFVPIPGTLLRRGGQ